MSGRFFVFSLSYSLIFRPLQSCCADIPSSYRPWLYSWHTPERPSSLQCHIFFSIPGTYCPVSISGRKCPFILKNALPAYRNYSAFPHLNIKGHLLNSQTRTRCPILFGFIASILRYRYSPPASPPHDSRRCTERQLQMRTSVGGTEPARFALFYIRARRLL